jgi:hypothetical protein
MPSVASLVVLGVWAQVLRSFAGVGAIERRWAFNRAINHRIDRSNRKAPNCLLICITYVVIILMVIFLIAMKSGKRHYHLSGCALLIIHVRFYYVVAPCSYLMIVVAQIHSPSFAYTLTFFIKVITQLVTSWLNWVNCQ